MNKLDPKTDGSSAHIVDQNIAKLRELFPDCFTESSDTSGGGDASGGGGGGASGGGRWKVDFDSLREILGDYVEDQQERYSFTWNGKARARRIAQTPSTGTLRPCPEESVNWDTTQNLFIEGDNLEVLKLLQKSYHRKVKMIYIDPPYNTGKEFIYPDKFQDNLGTYLKYTGQTDEEGLKLSANAETSGRYHTNWLNMMLPRLKLARNLLRDDGAIFVSIDDNELANLRKVCDEVFGEENYVGLISRATGTRMGTGSRGIARELDYLLVYSKTDAYYLRKLSMEAKELALYNQEDNKGRYLTRSLRRTGGENRREDRPSMYYPVTSPEGNEVFPIAPEGYESRWVCGRDTYEQLLHDGYIEWKKVTKNGEERWQVYQKHYLQDGLKESSNLWTKDEGNKKATRDLSTLFDGTKVFDHPKPVGLNQKIIQLGTVEDKEQIVLDFFAGSGTTAHAVMAQNYQDGGSRRFVAVQLPEVCDETSEAFRTGYPTIAEIAKERIRRVIQKIDDEQEQKAKAVKEKLPGMTEAVPKLDLGFKVFKLDASNIKPWDADFDDLEQAVLESADNIKSDRTEQDVLYELLLKFGLDLTIPIEERKIARKKVYCVGAGALIVCLDKDITLDVVEGIAALKDELKPEIMRVVFRDSGFKDDVVKTNAVLILKQVGLSDEHIRSI